MLTQLDPSEILILTTSRWIGLQSLLQNEIKSLGFRFIDLFIICCQTYPWSTVKMSHLECKQLSYDDIHMQGGIAQPIFAAILNSFLNVIITWILLDVSTLSQALGYIICCRWPQNHVCTSSMQVIVHTWRILCQLQQLQCIHKNNFDVGRCSLALKGFLAMFCKTLRLRKFINIITILAEIESFFLRRNAFPFCNTCCFGVMDIFLEAKTST